LGFCFVSGPLRADVWIERKGYVPGENILFCAHVDNQSGEKMKFSRVQLIEVKPCPLRSKSMHDGSIYNQFATFKLKGDM